MFDFWEQSQLIDLEIVDFQIPNLSAVEIMVVLNSRFGSEKPFCNRSVDSAYVTMLMVFHSCGVFGLVAFSVDLSVATSPC